VPARFAGGAKSLNDACKLAARRIFAVRLRRSTLRSCALCVFLSAVLCPSPRASLIAQSTNEYQVKAAFLFNFAKFIDWPEKSFANPQAPFMVCIVGHDPFGSALDAQFLSQTVDNRSLQIARFPVANSLVVENRCQIAFISSSEKEHFRQVIESFQGQSILLVGDADGFAESGGAIEFVLEEDHVRFAINPEAAERADLHLSSKLLAVARIVHGDQAKGKS
jgi:hypothetical protein